jgi:CRP/FNR family cyclic AMP-dependent transcriptional regulator
MDLFAGLAPDALAARTSRTLRSSAADGELVFKTGDPGDSMFFVRLGRVRLAVTGEGGRQLMLGVFGRADVVGELAFIDGRRRSADALACAESELFQLTREGFEAAAREAPVLREELPARLLRVITYRLRVTTQELKAAED